jgi:hypothetical protein
MRIPPNEQVDALLSGRIWSLVQKYCDGKWSSLAGEWTVSIEDIRNEAYRRGLDCFVSPKPISEGYWLCPRESGYEVFYYERGIKMYGETFEMLSSAFDAWLGNELKSLQLPRNA